MNTTFDLRAFQPVALHVMDLGPFQGELQTLDFLDEHDEPCNIYMLVSQNGLGKTTLLEAMVFLIGLLEPTLRSDAGPPPWLQDHLRARMQLDIKVQVTGGASDGAWLLSVMAGANDDPTLKWWSDEDLKRIGVSGWARVGYRYSHFANREKVEYCSDELVSASLRQLRELLAQSVSKAPSGGFDEPDLIAPTVLYFPSSRDLERLSRREERRISQPQNWDWSLVKRFGREGRRWTDSPDGLLVWLYWLGDEDGRGPRAAESINRLVFKGTPKRVVGVTRNPPGARVSQGGQTFRLDQLSSGERALVQLALRIGAHQTVHTWVVIDEVDLHLHPRWEYRVVQFLKKLAESLPGITVIASAQSHEALRAFGPQLSESHRRLRKGGFIIESEEFASSEGEDSR